MRRHTITKHIARANYQLQKKLPKRLTKKLKKAYSTSVHKVSAHPYLSLSILTLGVGLVSGAAFMLSKRNHRH